MSQVKLFRVEGLMKIKNTWQKFTIELPGTKISEIIDRVYTWLGSRHKLSRLNIRILNVKVIKPEEAKKKDVIQLLTLDRIIRFW